MKIASFNSRKSADQLLKEESALVQGHFPLMYLNDGSTGVGSSIDEPFQLGPKLAEWLPLNILVVDDAEVNQLLVTRMLEKLGYAVTVVSNGQEAFDAVMKANYELVLMDLYMPLLNGVDATRMIKENLEDEAPLVIGITSTEFEDELNEGREAGIDDYLQKPFGTSELMKKINLWEGELRLKMKN